MASFLKHLYVPVIISTLFFSTAHANLWTTVDSVNQFGEQYLYWLSTYWKTQDDSYTEACPYGGGCIAFLCWTGTDSHGRPCMSEPNSSIDVPSGSTRGDLRRLWINKFGMLHNGFTALVYDAPVPANACFGLFIRAVGSEDNTEDSTWFPGSRCGNPPPGPSPARCDIIYDGSIDFGEIKLTKVDGYAVDHVFDILCAHTDQNTYIKLTLMSPNIPLDLGQSGLTSSLAIGGHDLSKGVVLQMHDGSNPVRVTAKLHQEGVVRVGWHTGSGTILQEWF